MVTCEKRLRTITLADPNSRFEKKRPERVRHGTSGTHSGRIPAGSRQSVQVGLGRCPQKGIRWHRHHDARAPLRRAR